MTVLIGIPDGLPYCLTEKSEHFSIAASDSSTPLTSAHLGPFQSNPAISDNCSLVPTA